MDSADSFCEHSKPQFETAQASEFWDAKLVAKGLPAPDYSKFFR
jgi:hypothetical protein